MSYTIKHDRATSMTWVTDNETGHKQPYYFAFLDSLTADDITKMTRQRANKDNKLYNIWQSYKAFISKPISPLEFPKIED